jgi:aspartate-semialdehyde dehydrogenase
VESEPLKILGRFTGQEIEPLPARISAHCNRVPVTEGHTETVSVELEAKPRPEELLAAFQAFRGLPQERGLPSAPARPVIYLPERDRPQPRRDAERERGMDGVRGAAARLSGAGLQVRGHGTQHGARGRRERRSSTPS